MALKLQFFLFIFGANLFVTNPQVFYKALYSNSLETIELAIEKLEEEKGSATNKVYKGALLMKKADYLKAVAKKVEVFKFGHKLLEEAIEEYPNNIEYRFIRLTIQEHAPKILKYNKNIEEDKALVIGGYEKMSSKTRSYIMDYAEESEVLKIKDLQ
jgi:deoxyribodipyrimidine photolyase